MSVCYIVFGYAVYVVCSCVVEFQENTLGKLYPILGTRPTYFSHRVVLDMCASFLQLLSLSIRGKHGPQVKCNAFRCDY